MGNAALGTCARLCAIASLAVLAHCSADDEITSIPAASGDTPAVAATSGSEPTSMGPDDPGQGGPTDDPDAGPTDGDAMAADGGDAGPNKAAWFGAARCANSGLAFCDSFE